MPDDKLDKIQHDLSEMKTDIALLINKIDRNYNLTEKHEHTLYGNGGVGLTSKVKDVEDVRRDLSGHVATDQWLFGTMIALLLFSMGRIFNVY